MAELLEATLETPLVEGPLDGAVIELWQPLPEHLSMNLPERWGGPGVVFYDLDEEDGEPCYRFAGWDYERVSDPF